MKTNKLLIVVLLLGSSILVSCMPSVMNYYHPEAEGGTTIKSMCGGQAGPEDKIEFPIDGVKISIWSNEIQDGISFQIGITIPKDKEVQIRTSLVKVLIPSIENAFEGVLDPLVYSNGKPSWKIGDILIGETRERSGFLAAKGTFDKVFNMTTQVNMPKSEIIKLILPTFYINNKQWDLPEISFSKEKWRGVLPLNC